MKPASLLRGLAAIALTLATIATTLPVPFPARAQGADVYPSKPIKIIVGYSLVRERMAQLGIEAEGGTAEEFAKVIATEIPLWAALAKANNVKAD